MTMATISATPGRYVLVLGFLVHPSAFILPPSAKADDLIDSPMYREPELPLARVVAKFPDSFRGLWLQALDRPEVDFRCRAALSIAQGHERGMTGLEAAIPALIRELDRPDQHPTVRLAAARALIVLNAKEAAPVLLKAASSGDNDLRELIEPALARWAFAPVREEWLRRLYRSEQQQDGVAAVPALDSRPPVQRRGTVLAIQSLATTGEEKAIPRLRELLMSSTASATIKLEAARALGLLRKSGFEADADLLAADPSPRGLVGRLAAASLLRHHDGAEAIRRLQAFTRDAEPTVAAIALARLVEIDPGHVVPDLPTVLASPDANVRSFGVLVLFRKPSDEHVRLLGDRLSDPHPEVRNQARRSLAELAAATWRDQVIRSGERALAGRDWRGREQAAVLLARLGHKPVSARLVELLQDDRPEVAVAAAWGLRQLLVPDTLPAALDYFRRNTQPGEPAKRRGLPMEALDDQLSQLAQFFGAGRYRPADAALRPLVPPQAPAGFETRAAACWALGRIHDGKSNAELTGAFTGRVTAVRPMDVEDNRVRRMSAVALGQMKAANALPTLREFYRSKMPSLDIVNNACGWAVEQITGEKVPPPSTIEFISRDWFLTALD